MTCRLVNWLVRTSLVLTAAVLLALPTPTAAQGTRTIDNVAEIGWLENGEERTRPSNLVSLNFKVASYSVQPMLPASGGLPIGSVRDFCAAGQSGQTGQSAGDSIRQLSQSKLVTTKGMPAGRPFVLSLALPDANVRPNAVDEVTITVRTANGDEERITFLETGPDTGVFLAVVQTTRQPVARGDCRFSVEIARNLDLTILNSSGAAVAATSLAILAEPFNIVFDSRDGEPLSGIRVTLVDAVTGQPARVFGADGSSVFPATIVTGQRVVDAGGTVYDLPEGEFRFPFVLPGSYRLLVEPLAPYIFPSTATAAQLALLARPGGGPFVIGAASFGSTFTITAPGPIRFDVPLDRPPTALVLGKTASVREARAGELVRYELTVRNPEARAIGPLTIDDRLPEQMRFRRGSARRNGEPVADPASIGARTLRFTLPALAPGASATISYLLEVRPDARPGDAINRAQVTAGGLLSNVADAIVRIRRDELASRIVIWGRVLGGGCNAKPEDARGIPNIRVMLQDGSFAVTDRDGRYHFEGVAPGTHVVQLDRSTIPAVADAVDCANDVRSGGRGFSRWVQGSAGDLRRVDFRLAGRSDPVQAPARAATPAPERPKVVSDAQAAGDRDWLAGQEPGTAILFPTETANPRAPVTRVVVKHAPGQSVRLFADDRPVDPIAFEGTRKNDRVAVSEWRGIALPRRSTTLRAEIRNADGTLAETLRRTVIFANVPSRVELVRERSLLVADGIRRPVIALRFTDRSGRPVHHGLSGSFDLPAPYFPATEADAQQARQLAGLEEARPTWQVQGDEGLAFIELEPTTASGSLSLRFQFRDGEVTREQRLEAWMSPGDRPWTVVGLAEGTVGFDRLDRNMEALGPETRTDLVDGRLALYAKGRVLGRWLMTLSYDSDRQAEDQRLGGVIDPTAYYTIYADRSERRYDAASIRRLYLRLERPQFYALFGDYETGIDEPVLARYLRTLNGGKAEYRSERVSAMAFAADTPLANVREEIQGNGLSGPYALRNRNLVANSETILIEVRDRFRSERIVEQRPLTRHVDYDIDYRRGTIRFRQPVLSRTSALDPQFIVINYEVEGGGESVLNAGGRAAWRSANQRVQLAGTAIRDDDGRTRTDLVGADVRAQVTPATEIRAELAASRREDDGGEASTARAWQVEVEHRAEQVDLLGYATEREAGFGVGQSNTAENGTRKFGLDGRLRFGQALSVTGSGWHQRMLASDSERTAARLLAEYRDNDNLGRLGVTFARDRLADGREANSSLLNIGGTRRLLGGRLELGAESEVPLWSENSIDFPQRHRFDARLMANRWATLVGSYEITDGSVQSRVARVGVDLAPWAGGRIAVSGNMENIAEYGPRSFAAFGLSQSVILSRKLSVNVSVDSNRTLSGIDPAGVLDPLQPAASGGFVGDGTQLTEDFTAVTAGATYRSGLFSVTGRAEYRDGTLEDRAGLVLGALRQIGDGRALGGRAEWYRARRIDGAVTGVASAQLSWANRPGNRPLTWLNKLEFRRDSVTGGQAGIADAFGQSLLISGDATSMRATNALTMNYSHFDNRLELSAFWGLRYVSEAYHGEDIGGFSNLLSLDGRWSLGRHLELGAAGSVRHGLDGQSVAFAAGPQVGLKPFANGWIVAGYNIVGFRDREFAEDRFTRSGFYLNFRLKFDELTLGSLVNRVR